MAAPSSACASVRTAEPSPPPARTAPSTYGKPPPSLREGVVRIPDGDDDAVRVPAELKSDLLVRRLPGRVSDKIRDDEKHVVENVEIVQLRMRASIRVHANPKVKSTRAHRLLANLAGRV